MSGSSDPAGRLLRAVDVAFRLRGITDPVERKRLLAEHEDLRELVEPLLERTLTVDIEPVREVAGLPRQFGDFEILGELGRGGMGVVCEARQISLDRRVALKVLAVDHGDSARRLARFRREALAAARIRHPAIVPVLAAGDEEGRPWIAHELVEGGRTLQHHIEELRRRPAIGVEDYERLTEWIATIADALHVAHTEGVLHRDVKPANLLITPDGRPMVADFGLARVAGDVSLSETGDVAGTPFYMSPEQARGEHSSLDGRSDQFSLAATLYECLTLRRPFGGDSIHQILRSVATVDPPEPSSLHKRLPRDLSVVCMKALEKEPARRYPDMAEFAADLRRVFAHEPIVARPPGIARRVQKWTLRHPAWSAAIGLTSVALVVILTLLVQNIRANNELREKYAGWFTATSVERARELWPQGPEDLAQVDAWLTDAEKLLEWRDGFVSARNKTTEVSRASLLDDILDNIDQLGGQSGLIERVRTRREFAETVDARSLSESRPRALWDDAIASIRNPAVCPEYSGLRVMPQRGLVPIGRNSVTGLWEFWHLRSGTDPRADGEGGIVLVLVPCGSGHIGAQSEDASLVLFDELAANDSPVTPVNLDPFFMGKYEVTQGQWRRMEGESTSQYQLGALHPVESVSRDEALRVLENNGLSLPTEAQWEFAARAGTPTAFWTGDDPASLQGAANIADAWASEQPDWPPVWTAFEAGVRDGQLLHGPVGLYEPNPFGLHDVHGNVFEWVRDSYGEYPSSLSGNGMRDATSNLGVCRGGSYKVAGEYARSAHRYRLVTSGSEQVGVRAARRLDGFSESE